DSKSCVRSNDIDGDGDLDLFIGARVIPGKYPLPVTSRIYRNDTKNGVVHFTDITKEGAPDLENIGMVTDAVFADINNDKQNDLILTLE
ncbi:FG-GAP-like repeat-containing protein, partial [Pseudomonas aeruginosa]|uniref:FG-GAP-like repeat-containing protein n=1 Tax=Pseudomonas aeruginosa TaxID=287 RepID=UPI002B40DFCC